MWTTALASAAWSEDDLAMLQSIERRVLWLTTYTLHYAPAFYLKREEQRSR